MAKTSDIILIGAAAAGIYFLTRPDANAIQETVDALGSPFYNAGVVVRSWWDKLFGPTSTTPNTGNETINQQIKATPPSDYADYFDEWNHVYSTSWKQIGNLEDMYENSRLLSENYNKWRQYYFATGQTYWVNHIDAWFKTNQEWVGNQIQQLLAQQQVPSYQELINAQPAPTTQPAGTAPSIPAIVTPTGTVIQEAQPTSSTITPMAQGGTLSSSGYWYKIVSNGVLIWTGSPMETNPSVQAWQLNTIERAESLGWIY